MTRKPGSCAEQVLMQLCERDGYCLPAERQERILAEPPETPDAFLDAVLAGELDRDEMNPNYDVDTQTRKALLAFISDWLFDDGQGRGTKSGLPRFPDASSHSAQPSDSPRTAGPFDDAATHQPAPAASASPAVTHRARGCRTQPANRLRPGE